jgi:hypothetical protein
MMLKVTLHHYTQRVNMFDQQSFNYCYQVLRLTLLTCNAQTHATQLLVWSFHTAIRHCTIVVSEGDIDEVNKRLDTCNVDEQDDTGNTLLHRACEYGHVEIVRLLLSVFARTDITDDDGVTPIEMARQRGYMNIVDLLEKPMLATRAANYQYQYTTVHT